MLKQTSLRQALTSATALLFILAADPALAESAAQQSKTAAVKATDPAGSERLSWSDESRAALDRALMGRSNHGLDRLTFLADAPADEQPDARNVRYTRAALGYASALARGQIDPATLHDAYTLPRPELDVRAGLRTALADGGLEAWLASLAPQDDEYARLSKAYLSYRDAAAGTSAAVPITSSGSIHVGDSDPPVSGIAQQLVDDDYLPTMPSNSGSDPLPYSPAIADAVTALQNDYGIVADGIVGPDTLGVLNMGPGDRARALAVALERRRWLSRTPPATRIDVNTAAARLRYWRDGQVVDERRVIVGEPGRETPMLGSPIYRLVANPTWTIPKSIQNGEMANVGSSYLRAHNMVMKDGWIVQQPGRDNALGLVKFDMQNQYAIYLHDTSSPGLFERSQRHLSHGCVRVSDALGFADMLAEQEGVADEWRKARDSRQQTFVPLPQQIPVRLTYGNVFVDRGGRVVFRTDPYGWNEAVATALGFGGGSTKQAKAKTVDIGP